MSGEAIDAQHLRAGFSDPVSKMARAATQVKDSLARLRLQKVQRSLTQFPDKIVSGFVEFRYSRVLGRHSSMVRSAVPRSKAATALGEQDQQRQRRRRGGIKCCYGRSAPMLPPNEPVTMRYADKASPGVIAKGLRTHSRFRPRLMLLPRFSLPKPVSRIRTRQVRDLLLGPVSSPYLRLGPGERSRCPTMLVG